VPFASHPRLLTPVATPVSPHGDWTGRSKFSDYTKCGLVIAMRWLFVATYIVPLHGRFWPSARRGRDQMILTSKRRSWG